MHYFPTHFGSKFVPCLLKSKKAAFFSPLSKRVIERKGPDFCSGSSVEKGVDSKEKRC